MNPFRHFGRTPWTGDRSIANLHLHRTEQHNTEKRGHTFMPRAVSEPKIPLFGRFKSIRNWYRQRSCYRRKTEIRHFDILFLIYLMMPIELHRLCNVEWNREL